MDRIISKTGSEPQHSSNSKGSLSQSSLREADWDFENHRPLNQQPVGPRSKPALEIVSSIKNGYQSSIQWISDNFKEESDPDCSRPIFCPKPPTFLICPSNNGQSFIHHLDPALLRYTFDEGHDDKSDHPDAPENRDTNTAIISASVRPTHNSLQRTMEVEIPSDIDLLNNLVNFLWKLLSFQNIMEADCKLSSLELPILKSFLDRKYPSLNTFWTAE